MVTEIIIKLKKNDNTFVEVKMDTENPSLDSLINKITEIKDIILIDETEISSYPINFDHEEFKNVVINTFNSYLKEIKINNKLYEAALKTLPKEK